ncbi:S8 family peptidase [Chromohalobacter israelensis]|uniref:Peptidase S8 and S53, subtilisin, kexin, sedolisin n=1 Tax=Chromohalobacter israelensis (strain ATCC BAA-138 / DSM 3043 / CIP 106854 / NCIMB 13768 / 1H11) TaxID=290398 RepID=Q1QYL9_CHRI1|nr:S8 family peptidase [Chromohalobacter salexigens]ABE58439.1 peptidase S8 and S53, subtilisin, kexin, sedolisin [Chromohalobacter salexigens DSM 3043]
MAEKNFLLGKGERLADPIVKKTAGGEKKLPYSYDYSSKFIKDKASEVEKYLKSLQEGACPDGRFVASITIHPRFISKSDYPLEFLRIAGFETIGGRSQWVEPKKWGVECPPADGAVTDTLYVSTSRSKLLELVEKVPGWNPENALSRQLRTIEDFSVPSPESKIKSLLDEGGDTREVYELVLHGSADDFILKNFFDYCKALGVEPIREKLRAANGITFIPVRSGADAIVSLSAFTFVRVVRKMPGLRTFRPAIYRSDVVKNLNFPNVEAVDKNLKVAIFDGGIPKSSPLLPWVNYIEPYGIGPEHPDAVDHGEAVTSAVLFGHLTPAVKVERPFCQVDHIRVIDKNTGADADFEFYDCLDRILEHLDGSENAYDFVNFSLGPDLAVEDDEVNRWTSELDQRFSSNKSLAVVAVGNTGERDHFLGLNRIQPPSDGVNVLSVGACDSYLDDWAKAPYSSIGPGRTPGVAKPDGLAFGGCFEHPFGVYSSSQDGLVGTKGTSFATPFALKSCIGCKALIGSDISPLAVRALMVHRAESGSHQREHVGWGRFITETDNLLTCNDDEITVIYQGELPVGKYLRAPIPLPDEKLEGNVDITATLVITPEVDPAFVHAYTRGGLEAVFRPNETKPSQSGDPKYPATDSFFSENSLSKDSEFKLRSDGHKWEPCWKASKKKRGSSLVKPSFDIYYHNRDEGKKDDEAKPIPYAFIVSVKAPKVKNLYEQVLNAYSDILVPLETRVDVPVRT